MYTWPGAVRFRQRAPGVNQFELVSRGDCIAGMCTFELFLLSTALRGEVKVFNMTCQSHWLSPQ